MEQTPRTPRNLKAQVEFIQEEDGSITINVHDPATWENFEGRDILDLFEVTDTGSPIVRILTTMLSGLSYIPEVHKIRDVRTGREIDVKDRDFTKDIKGALGLGKSKSDGYIRDLYNERVEKGIIDESEFPFEEFLKDYRDNNQ